MVQNFFFGDVTANRSRSSPEQPSLSLKPRFKFDIPGCATHSYFFLPLCLFLRWVGGGIIYWVALKPNRRKEGETTMKRGAKVRPFPSQFERRQKKKNRLKNPAAVDRQRQQEAVVGIRGDETHPTPRISISEVCECVQSSFFKLSFGELKIIKSA